MDVTEVPPRNGKTNKSKQILGAGLFGRWFSETGVDFLRSLHRSRVADLVGDQRGKKERGGESAQSNRN